MVAGQNFYSKSTGNLNVLSTWGQNPDGSGAQPPNFSTPGQVFNVRNNSNPTISASWTVSGAGSSVIVGDGTNACIFTVPSNFVFTAPCDISNNGTLRVTSTAGTPYSGVLNVAAGGTYEHARDGGSIPTATWDITSNCNITGVTTTAPGGSNQTFGNLLWNCPSQSQPVFLATINISGNLTIQSTNGQEGRPTAGAAHSVGGDYYHNGGIVRWTRNVNGSLTVTGNVTIAGGECRLSNGTGIGTLNLLGNLTISGGTLTETGSASGLVNFNKSGTQTFLKTSGTISQIINFVVNSGSVLDVGTSIIDGSSGTFNLLSGAGLISANSQGISSTPGTGSIQVTGTKTFSTGADYTYNGTVSQITGNALPSTVRNLTIVNTNGVTNSQALTITGLFQSNGQFSSAFDIDFNGTTACGGSVNATAGTVVYLNTALNILAGVYNNLTKAGASVADLCGDVTVNGTLNFSAGKINIGTNNLTIGSSGQITGVSLSSYVIAESSGVLKQYVSSADKLFPVGTSSSYVPITLNNTGGTADNYSVNLFATVTDNGLSSGSPVSFLEDCVKITWRVGEDVAGGSSLDITTQWSAVNEGSTFTRGDCSIGFHNGSEWTPDPAGSSSASGSNPYTQMRTDITDVGSFAVGNKCTKLGDNEPPVITVGPSDQDVSLDASCSFTVPNYLAGVTASDNCGLTLTQSPLAGSLLAGVHNGTQLITITATDAAGLSDTHTFTITYKDVTPPVITVGPSDQDVSLDASCSFTVPNYLAGVTASDNCGLTLTQSPLAGSLLAGVHNGTQLITITATDAAGLSDTHTFTITYKDVTPPVVICKDATIYLDVATGIATLTPDMVDGGSTDNCGPLLFSLSKTTFDCTEIGTHLVWLYVRDVTGNIDSCLANVTVDYLVTPVPTVTVADSVLCNNTTTQIVLSNSFQNMTFRWTAVADPAIIGYSTDSLSLPITINDLLVNSSNEVKSITYIFTPFAYGLCQLPDIQYTLYVQPTPRLTVSIPDTVVCDSSTINITVNDGNGAVAGGTTKVYQLTTTNAGGNVLGVQATDEYIAGTPIVNTLINLTNEVQAVTYHFKARIRDDRPGHLGSFCDHGVDTTITVYVNPTPRFTVSIADTIVCDSTTITLNVADLLGAVEGTKVYDLTTVYTAGAVLGVEATTANIPMGTSIVNQLINTTNVVQAVRYNFRYRLNDPRNGGIAFCDHGVDTTITVYVNPTTQFLVSVDDSIICDQTTLTITVTDLLGQVIGGKVYDLTTTYIPGTVTGVIPDGTYPITQNVVNTLLNNTNVYQTITYHLKYRLTDTRYGGIPFCDHGTDTTIIIYLEPTARVNAVIDTDTICNNGAINISWSTPTIPTSGIVLNVTIINPYPVEITNYTGGTGLPVSALISNSLNNSGDTARMIMYVISPVLLDSFNNQKCPGVNDTIRVWINPTQRVIPLIDDPRICSATTTDVLLTTPTVMTKGQILFDYNISLTGLPGQLSGNEIPQTGLLPGSRLQFNYTNSSDTIQSVYFNITPRVTELGCADGVVYPAEVKVHPLPILDIIVTNPVTCTGGNDAALMAVLSKGAAPYQIFWTGPDEWTATNIIEATNLFEGLYEITVTDSLGCTNMESLTIFRTMENIRFSSQLKAPNFTYNLTCNGSNDGEIDFWVTDGTSYPYDYWITTAQGDTLWSGMLSGNRVLSDTTTFKKFTNLSARQYILNLRDVNGCMSYRSVFVSQPPPMVINKAAQTYEGGFNITCRGRTDGSAWVVSTTGGNVGPKTYEWSTSPLFLAGEITPGPLLENVGAGTYYIKATDSMGCEKIDSITLIEPDGIELINTTLSFSADSAYNISCFGGTNGSIALEFGGGAGPYTYNWLNFPAGANIIPGSVTQSGLIAGTYDLEVEDANGCDRPYSFVLTQPDTLVITPALSFTFDNAFNINCFGGTGTIDLTVTGGSVGNYNYLWTTSDGSGLQPEQRDQSGLTAGSYMVQVTDSNGCVSAITIPLIQPDPIATAAEPTHITCESPVFDNGSINLTVTGGSGNYTYLWSNGATTPNISGLTEGKYLVTITDSYGCSAIDSAVVNLPPPLIISISGSDYNSFNISCYGLSDGWLEVTTLSGEPPYFYSWTGPDGFTASTSRIENIRAGTYTVTVTDNNQCIISDVYNVTQPSQLDITVALSQSLDGMYNINCYGSPTGIITLEAVNGVGTLQWLWSDGVTTPIRTGLPAGEYRVILTDQNLCVADSTLNLNQPDSIRIAFSVRDPMCYDNPDGDILVEVTGGVPGAAGYQYLWNDNTTTQDRIGVLPGFYKLTVTDFNGCFARDSVKLEPVREICLDIPNAFSPNGDLINDFWNMGMTYLYPNMEVTIFNRWGETVWRSTHTII